MTMMSLQSLVMSFVACFLSDDPPRSLTRPPTRSLTDPLTHSPGLN
jgi:hypothetical protein